VDGSTPRPLAPELFAREWDRKIAAGFEPAVTLRTSGLIGFEADGDENAERLEAKLRSRGVKPWVVEGRQADDGARLHVYARTPLEDCDAAPKVSFRFEAGTIIAASNNYFGRSGLSDPPATLLLVLVMQTSARSPGPRRASMRRR
jgi:hypothetical protein